jgi:hypothetical protein
LFDRKDETYFGPKENGETHLHLRLIKPVRASVLSLGLYNSSLYPRGLEVDVKTCGNGDMMFPVDYDLAISPLVLSYYFKPRDVCEIEISSASNGGQPRMVLSELSLGDGGHPVKQLPPIGSYVTPVYQMTEPQFSVHMTAAQTPEASTAMYRCADSADDVEKHGWVFDMLDPVRGDSRPAPAPYCQFNFMTDPTAASAGWRVRVDGAKVVSALAD